MGRELHPLSDAIKRAPYDIANFYNARVFNRSLLKENFPKAAICEASRRMRGIAFFTSFVERFPKGQAYVVEDGEVKGVVLSALTSLSNISRMPSSAKDLPEGEDLIIFTLLADEREVASSLLNFLHGNFSGPVYAIAELSGLHSTFKERPSQEDVARILSDERSSNNLDEFSFFRGLGFEPLLEERTPKLLEKFSPNPLSFGYAAVMLGVV